MKRSDLELLAEEQRRIIKLCESKAARARALLAVIEEMIGLYGERREPLRPAEVGAPSNGNGYHGTNADRIEQVIRQRGPLSMSDAMRASGVPKGSMVNAVEKLEREGRITTEKRRNFRLLRLPEQDLSVSRAMTEQGEGSLAGRMLEAMPASVDRLQRRFGPEAMGELRRLQEEGIAAPSNGLWRNV